MSKIIAIIFYIILIIIIVWAIISWIEIISKNVDGIAINSWNFFKIIPKIF